MQKIIYFSLLLYTFSAILNRVDFSEILYSHSKNQVYSKQRRFLLKQFYYNYLKKFLILFLSLFLFTLSFLPNDTKSFDFSDLYQEVLRFDENGDLILSTYDSIATASVTYQTIGWTVKRKNLPIDDPNNTCVTIPLTKAGSKPDPNNPNNRFHYSYTSRSIILARIGEVSQEWLDIITTEGETVYLDAIMTVCHSGVPQGHLSQNGSFAEGEVYYTLEGIQNARNWGTQSLLSLATHFNKSVSCFIPVPIINTEFEHQYFHCNEYGLCIEQSAFIDSNEFNIKDGIPTSEALSLTGSATPYSYHLATELITGNRFYTVPVTVTYELTWTDEEGDSQSDTETISYFYTVERTYSYRQIQDFQLYYAESMDFINPLLPNTSVSIPSYYQPEFFIECSDKETDHLINPVIPSLSFDGGTIDGGSSCPSVPHEDFSKEAEDSLGVILVKNDFLSIDGQTILSDRWTKEKTEKPMLPSEPPLLFFLDSPFFIDNSFANGDYPSSAALHYHGIGIPDPVIEEILSVCDANTVTVHTPVICDASITDNRQFNQQVKPDLTKPSLILGESFTVSISCEGTHRPIQGYGFKDYQKYVFDYQIKFPFQVEKDNHIYTENTWISIDSEASFTLPVEVKEGNYTIFIRTCSLNFSSVPVAEQLEGTYSNYSLSEYFATDTIEVAVMGRLFGFHLTDLHDYPRWEGIFSTSEATTYQTDGYYIGKYNQNGKTRPILERFTLPVVPGSNPLDPFGDTLYLGYHYRFSVTTIGNFYDSDDCIEILCSYDYINKKTGLRFPVDLYYSQTVENTYSHLLPIQTSFLLDASCRVLSKQSYAVQIWSASDFLPLHLYAVPAGTILPLSNLKPDFWLSDGYIVVNYHIYACNGTTRYLDYWNLPNLSYGCCNMWQTEGFQKTKTGSDGLQYSLSQGDIIFYDLDHDFLEDYWFFGTH